MGVPVSSCIFCVLSQIQLIHRMCLFPFVHAISVCIAFSEEVEGASPKDVMDILLLSQYFDTLSAVGANSLILEHDPAVVAKLQDQVGKSFSNKTFKGK